MKRFTVYCASSEQIDESYLNSAFRLGEILAENNITLVYGGGQAGSMGKVANGALSKNGKVIGYIPQFMVELEWAHHGITELNIVENMQIRKQMMFTNCDAIIALPGGTGTAEELLEVISLKKLGELTQPIVLVNTDGFYNHLINFLNHTVDEKFMNEQHRNLWHVANSEEDVLLAVKNSVPWSKEAREFAAVRKN